MRAESDIRLRCQLWDALNAATFVSGVPWYLRPDHGEDILDPHYRLQNFPLALRTTRLRLHADFAVAASPIGWRLEEHDGEYVSESIMRSDDPHRQVVAVLTEGSAKNRSSPAVHGYHLHLNAFRDAPQAPLTKWPMASLSLYRAEGGPLTLIAAEVAAVSRSDLFRERHVRWFLQLLVDLPDVWDAVRAAAWQDPWRPRRFELRDTARRIQRLYLDARDVALVGGTRDERYASLIATEESY